MSGRTLARRRAWVVRRSIKVTKRMLTAPGHQKVFILYLNLVLTTLHTLRVDFGNSGDGIAAME
jgi:hypothetical protein